MYMYACAHKLLNCMLEYFIALFKVKCNINM